MYDCVYIYVCFSVFLRSATLHLHNPTTPPLRTCTPPRHAALALVDRWRASSASPHASLDLPPPPRALRPPGADGYGGGVEASGGSGGVWHGDDERLLMGLGSQDGRGGDDRGKEPQAGGTTPAQAASATQPGEINQVESSSKTGSKP